LSFFDPYGSAYLNLFDVKDSFILGIAVKNPGPGILNDFACEAFNRDAKYCLILQLVINKQVAYRLC
jgi:hypothetical protein